jgi:hypothetical protein
MQGNQAMNAEIAFGVSKDGVAPLLFFRDRSGERKPFSAY